jgi:8-oxo-dGTP pyrophosphatase MutT (NUDIX family)
MRKINVFAAEHGSLPPTRALPPRVGMVTAASSTKVREIAGAIVVDTSGRLLLQLRDDVPDILYPGKIGLFGGHREGNETFLDCVVREIHEELSYYLPPQRFEPIARLIGPDHEVRGGTWHAEFFIAREVPVDKLKVTEGRLRIVDVDELTEIENDLIPSARLALQLAFPQPDWHMGGGAVRRSRTEKSWSR